MIILGLGFTDHETSAALIINGKLCTAIARERLTRIKRDGKMWGTKCLDLTSAIKYCLQEHNLTLSDIDLIVCNHIDHISPSEIYNLLAVEGSIDLSSLLLISLPHHFAHACCSFYLSPFEEAAILVADGSGGPLNLLTHNCDGPELESLTKGLTIVQDIEREQSIIAREYESFYWFTGGRWEVLRKTVGHLGGIGAEYGSISEFLFEDCLDSGKTMGLASYGCPYSSQLFLERTGTEALPAFRSMHSSVRDNLEEQIKYLLESNTPLRYETPLLANFAASIQHETEEALLTHARWLRQHSDSRNLCLSGGVALNCVANSRLIEESGFDKVFVPPCPGDDGIALGCALYGAAINNELEQVENPVFLGRSYSHDPSSLLAIGLSRVFQNSDIFDVLAKEIANGAIIAWYQDGSEFGPRALGHRSFLADPRRPEIKDYINKKVKNRESFRPFAPVVLKEFVSEYFVEDYPSYFMSFVAYVREDKRAIVPAITHVDGTARYQVLRQQDNPQLHKLVSAFAMQTGVPILLNTSLNRSGEPLVETPLEAGRCAIASSADYLVVDGIIYQPISTK